MNPILTHIDFLVYLNKIYKTDMYGRFVADGSGEKVIPAKAGIQRKPLDPRFRGDDRRNKPLFHHSPDVFYHPTIKKKEDIYEKGFFLNSQLLEADLADPML